MLSRVIAHDAKRGSVHADSSWHMILDNLAITDKVAIVTDAGL